MKKNKYPHMLNEVEMRWKIMEELKWIPKVMWTPKIKERTCAQGNRISGNKWGSCFVGKFKFVKLMHIWEDLGEYLVEIFVGNCPHMGYHPYTLVVPS